MRVDYYHTGNATEERFSLDRIVVEPLPWPGNPARPIDDTNLGKYLFEVVDTATGQTVDSRGFASIYGEWETTAEAKTMNRTFLSRFGFLSSTSRFASSRKAGCTERVPRGLELLGRSGRQVRRTRRGGRAAGPLIKFHESGDPAAKLDLLMLCDGYTRSNAESSSAMRGGWLRRCSRRRRSRNVRATSTSGDLVRRRRSPG